MIDLDDDAFLGLIDFGGDALFGTLYPVIDCVHEFIEIIPPGCHEGWPTGTHMTTNPSEAQAAQRSV
jgi:hypothetical protein